MVVARTFIIADRLGMHALAATTFARTAKAFTAEIEVEKDGRRVDGRAVIDLLMLVAGAGSSVTVRGRGADAEQAVNVLGRLLEKRCDDEAAMISARVANQAQAEVPEAA